MNSITQAPRFSFTSPPHPDVPAIIDWHIYDNGYPSSIPELVRLANRLQREVDQLKAEAVNRPQAASVPA